MNLFNRTFLIIYSILLIAACAGLAVLAWNTGQMLDIEAGNFELQAFILTEGTDRWIFTAILGAVGLVGLVTLVTAVRPGRRAAVSGGNVRIRRDDGAVVDVDTNVIESMLREELERLDQVRLASAVVSTRKDVVESDITVTIQPYASIADVTDDILDATADVVRNQVGVEKVRRPTLHITYDEIEARPATMHRRPSRPAISEDELPPPPAEQPYREPAAAHDTSRHDTVPLPPPPPPPSGGSLTIGGPVVPEEEPGPPPENPDWAPEDIAQPRRQPRDTEPGNGKEQRG